MLFMTTDTDLVLFFKPCFDFLFRKKMEMWNVDLDPQVPSLF